MTGFGSKQTLQQQSLSAWLVFLRTAMVYSVVWHVVWWFCGGAFYWLIFIKLLYSNPSSKPTVRHIKQLSNIKCVSAVASEKIHLRSFIKLVLIMLRAGYLNIFFLHFSFYKKGLYRKSNGIFGISIKVSY